MNTYFMKILTIISFLNLGFGMDNMSDIESQHYHSLSIERTQLPTVAHSLYEKITNGFQEFFAAPMFKEYACQTLSTVTGGIILYGLYYSFGSHPQQE